MPPKVKVTKDEILEKAFDITRREGISALSARRLAEELNCSTKPIYRVYGSMKELEDEVIKRAKEYGMNLISEGSENPHPVINVELGYLDVFEKEQELFKLLFMSGKVAIDLADESFLFDIDRRVEQMKRDPMFEGLTESQLKRVLMDMAIYTYGMVSMQGNMHAKKRMHDSLHRMLKTLIEWEKQQAE